MTDLRKQRDTAQAFARQHCAECAEEIIAWQDSAVLRDGRLRELAELCLFAHDDALKVAEHMAIRAALEAAARGRTRQEDPGARPSPGQLDERGGRL